MRQRNFSGDDLNSVLYYESNPQVMTDWEAEEFLMDYGVPDEMLSDIQLVVIGDFTVWVGEKEYEKNQPVWPIDEYLKFY